MKKKLADEKTMKKPEDWKSRVKGNERGKSRNMKNEAQNLKNNRQTKNKKNPILECSNREL
jgi:hypothetical protein